MLFFGIQMELLFPMLFCKDHTSGWHIDTRSIVKYRHKVDQGDNGHFFIFLAGLSSVRNTQEKGPLAAGTRKWDAMQHFGPHFELSGVWLILCPLTKRSVSYQTLRLLYTALSPCVGVQIKATLIHNREALLNPAGALIKIDGFAPPREDVDSKDGKE